MNFGFALILTAVMAAMTCNVMAQQASPRCQIKPEFDKPVFVKPEFDKPVFVKPEFDKAVFVKPEFDKPNFKDLKDIRSEIVKPEFEKPVFDNGCLLSPRKGSKAAKTKTVEQAKTRPLPGISLKPEPALARKAFTAPKPAVVQQIKPGCGCKS